MKIIDQNFPSEIKLTDLDKEIYEEFLKIYQDLKVSSETAVIFANISFLLSSKQILDYLLRHLEDALKTTLNQKKLSITPRRKYSQISHIGLSWPLPEEKTDARANDTGHVVNDTLTTEEQKHKINSGGVPTLLGFLPNSLANELVEKHILWNEDPRIAPLFYHGKFTHRIQFYLIMKAIDLGYIKFNSEIKSVVDILNVLINNKNSVGNTFWNILLDSVVVLRNYEHIPNTPNPAPLTSRGFQPQLSLMNEYQNKYVFGMDPYFLHSYLLSHNVDQHPILSECLTRLFCKTALEIQQIEKELGYQVYIDRPWPPSQAPKLVPIKDYSISEVLSRIEKVFYINGAHVITPANVLSHREAKKKSIPHDIKTKLSNFSGAFWKSEDEKFSLDSGVNQAGIVEYR